MPVNSNVGKNLRQVFPTFKNRSIGVSELPVSLVCRSIVTCMVPRSCRTACVTGEFGRRTEVQVLSGSAVFGVCNLWILFQPMHELDIWHDLVGDYFKVSWGGESNLLIWSRQSMQVNSNVGKTMKAIWFHFFSSIFTNLYTVYKN